MSHTDPGRDSSRMCVHRRRLLVCLCAGLPAAAILRAAPAAAAAAAEMRRLHLINTHTGEELDARYFEDGVYCAKAMGTLDWLLRDHRNGAIFPIEPRLFDLLHALALAAGREPSYEVISGYRSPATNAMLVATTGGVSWHSLHMEGRAIDVRLVGVPTADLRDLALAQCVGGVGYYRVSDFVHLDTGRVRSWSG